MTNVPATTRTIDVPAQPIGEPRILEQIRRQTHMLEHFRGKGHEVERQIETTRCAIAALIRDVSIDVESGVLTLRESRAGEPDVIQAVEEKVALPAMQQIHAEVARYFDVANERAKDIGAPQVDAKAFLADLQTRLQVPEEAQPTEAQRPVVISKYLNPVVVTDRQSAAVQNPVHDPKLPDALVKSFALALTQQDAQILLIDINAQTGRDRYKQAAALVDDICKRANLQCDPQQKQKLASLLISQLTAMVSGTKNKYRLEGGKPLMLGVLPENVTIPTQDGDKVDLLKAEWLAKRALVEAPHPSREPIPNPRAARVQISDFGPQRPQGEFSGTLSVHNGIGDVKEVYGNWAELEADLRGRFGNDKVQERPVAIYATDEGEMRRAIEALPVGGASKLHFRLKIDGKETSTNCVFYRDAAGVLQFENEQTQQAPAELRGTGITVDTIVQNPLKYMVVDTMRVSYPTNGAECPPNRQLTH